MLIDKVKLYIYAGDGGKGGVYFESTGKPNGGNGGKGGNVIIEGTNNLYDLHSFTNTKEFRAQNGADGFSNNKQGKDGNDIILKVPLITSIYDLDNNLIVQIDKIGQKFVLASGGRGGLGNFNFRNGQFKTLKKTLPPDKGQAVECNLNLTLKADIVFIGLPNAGKSSMLNALSNARVKVASYPFTTLEPNLAVVDGVIFMDLPGLVEGTVDGKGLGSRFMKHAHYAKLIAHFVSLESPDIVGEYNLIRSELSKINPVLADKREIIILTKSDLYSPNYIQKRVDLLKKYEKEVLVVSVYDYTSVKALLKSFKKYLS